MSPPGVNMDEIRLLELLADINRLENKCKRFQAPVAVPASVYKKLDQLRAQIAKWGVEFVVQDENKNDKTKGSKK